MSRLPRPPRPVRRIVLGLAAAALAAAVAGGLSYTGYCSTQGRYLSDGEYFSATIAQILREKRHTLVIAHTRSVEFRPVNVINYGSEAVFRAVNPDCCRIVPHNVGDQMPYTSFWERLYGAAAVIVEVTYVLNYFDPPAMPEATGITTYYAVTNCGRAWNARH